MATGYDNANAPIVIFFGQSTGGKTTALVRLIRYLNTKGCMFEVDNVFHNFYYNHLADSQAKWDDIVDTINDNVNNRLYSEVLGTKERSLVNIISKGQVICRFLEVPGEDFINMQNAANINFVGDSVKYDYLNHAMSCDFKKIWIFFFDLNLVNANQATINNIAANYVNQIKNTRIGLNDKIIVLLNKIDLTVGVNGNALVQRQLPLDRYEDFINDNFNNILNDAPFATKRWNIFGIRDSYKRHYKLLGYSSFSNETAKAIGEGERIRETESNAIYPAELWKAIDAAIKNRY